MSFNRIGFFYNPLFYFIDFSQLILKRGQWASRDARRTHSQSQEPRFQTQPCHSRGAAWCKVIHSTSPSPCPYLNIEMVILLLSLSQKSWKGLNQSMHVKPLTQCWQTMIHRPDLTQCPFLWIKFYSNISISLHLPATSVCFPATRAELSRVVVTENTWPAKPKIFSIRSFTEMACWPFPQNNTWHIANPQ